MRHARNRGKAAAMTTGADYVARHESVEAPGGASATPAARRSTPRPLLFVDGDLEESAANVGVLVPARPARGGPT